MSFLAFRGFLASILALAWLSAVHAQAQYPSKPIRIIVPAAPAGALDITTRLVADKMREVLGQQVIVENRAGADTLLGTRYVKDAPSDGYTILAQANGFTALPAIRRDAGYEPLKDFMPVGMMVRAPSLMLVSASAPDGSVPAFVERARRQKLTYASAGVGGPPHLAAALFFRQAGVDMLHVPYKGNGPALIDVAGGSVPVIFSGYSSAAPYLKSGKLRAVGVTSVQRIGQLPEVPTFQEQGVNYTYYFWLGLVAPRGTPSEAIQRLSEAVRYAVNSKELKERFNSEGSEPVSWSSGEFAGYLRDEANQMRDLKLDEK